ncbi:MAG: diaminopimelate epimerase [Chthoniobacteraceae bacterium]|nr:diaminopimelate epimerase [Chthoniobacteraceae bacterium]
MLLHFTKMNGAGNDFVVVDNRRKDLPLSRETIARLCDRHRGAGADGLLAVEPAEQGADFRMRYYNADGGEAEMCGNGARCFTRYAGRLAGKTGRIRFETQAGIIAAECVGDLIRLDMSDPQGLALNESVALEKATLTVHSVNTGVPHAVVAVDNLEAVPVMEYGAGLRYHAHFAPRGTNANFIQPVDAHTIAIRTYERGVEGETLACGTGVTASALIFHELTGAASPVSVRVRGGDTLQVGFEKANGAYRNVTLTGPADFVYEGEIEL